MRTFKTTASVLGLGLLVAACGGGGDEIVFDTVLGPETKQQIKPLPSTLQGDKDNARYSGDNLRGENMESSDGTL